jgi:hypothetical protein
MQNLGKTISAALLVAILGACGDATGPVDAESERKGTTSGTGTGVTAPPPPPGGGTYGSGGNLIPGGTFGGPALMESSAGGGTYGSGGKAAPDSTGSNTLTGASSSTTDCAGDDELGGGTYGSGGRITDCATEPTP